MRLVDLPSANGKCFVQLAGVGLDAQVVKETSLAFKRSFGPLSYLISAAQIAHASRRSYLSSRRILLSKRGHLFSSGMDGFTEGPFHFSNTRSSTTAYLT
jgi:diacylglycerol kinase family enzyme